MNSRLKFDHLNLKFRFLNKAAVKNQDLVGYSMDPLHSDSSRRNKNNAQNASNSLCHLCAKHYACSNQHSFCQTGNDSKPTHRTPLPGPGSQSPRLRYLLNACVSCAIRSNLCTNNPKVHQKSKRHYPPSKNGHWPYNSHSHHGNRFANRASQTQCCKRAWRSRKWR